MPELPEVEVTKRVLESQISGMTITHCRVFQPKMRWPIPEIFAQIINGAVIASISRRSKYLIISTSAGYWLAHLGMSGYFSVVDNGRKLLRDLEQCNSDRQREHRHVVWLLDGGESADKAKDQALVYCDPRRFGCILWLGDRPQHKLLDKLGVEPLSDELTADYLFMMTRTKKIAIKSFLMDAHNVVGIGNIYANEALHQSGIHPLKQTQRLSRLKCADLVIAIKEILTQAIDTGGSSINDFQAPDSNIGYFQTQFLVYGQENKVCSTCKKTNIIRIVHGQRSTFFCASCQK